jgi:hypothetical protein
MSTSVANWDICKLKSTQKYLNAVGTFKIYFCNIYLLLSYYNCCYSYENKEMVGETTEKK